MFWTASLDRFCFTDLYQRAISQFPGRSWLLTQDLGFRHPGMLKSWVVESVCLNFGTCRLFWIGMHGVLLIPTPCFNTLLRSIVHSKLLTLMNTIPTALSMMPEELNIPYHFIAQNAILVSVSREEHSVPCQPLEASNFSKAVSLPVECRRSILRNQ